MADMILFMQNEKPDRVVPLILLKEMEKEGKIGGVFEYFYTTTGTEQQLEIQ